MTALSFGGKGIELLNVEFGVRNPELRIPHSAFRIRMIFRLFNPARVA
jgi:hypothetical protein